MRSVLDRQPSVVEPGTTIIRVTIRANYVELYDLLVVEIILSLDYAKMPVILLQMALFLAHW